jgi:hypothetical protein
MPSITSEEKDRLHAADEARDEVLQVDTFDSEDQRSFAR